MSNEDELLEFVNTKQKSNDENTAEAAETDKQLQSKFTSKNNVRTVQEYEEQIEKLQSRIHELEEWNASHQEDELRKPIEIQKEVEKVDKDLLSQELEQANQKLNWFNEKFKEYSDLQTNLDLIKVQNKQLENDLQIQQQTNQANLQRLEEYEKNITQLQQEIDQINFKQSEDLNRLLIEERQRCDALANDKDSMLRILEEIQAQNKQLENDLQIQQQTNQANLQRLEEYEKNISQLQQEIDQLNSKQSEDLNRLLIEERQRCNALANDKDSMLRILEEIQAQNKQLENDLQIQQQTNQANLQRLEEYEKNISQLQQEIDQINSKQSEDLNRLLIEERQRCDALANDKDSMLRILEEIQAQNKQLENDLQIQQQTNQANLQRLEEYEKNISQLQQEIDQINSKQSEDLNRLLIEERQRCDALANDKDSMLRILEEIQAQNKQLENDLQIQQQTNQANLQRLEEYEKNISQLQQEIDQLNSKQSEDLNRLLIEERQRCNALANDKDSMLRILEEIQAQNKQLENDLQIQQQTNQANLQRFEGYEKNISQLQQEIDQFNSKQTEDLNRLLIEERQRYDALAKDNDSTLCVLEEIQAQNKQLGNDLQIQQQTNQGNLQRFEEYEKNISQLQEEIDQINSKQTEDLNPLLTEERERCDALVNDNDSMRRLLEEARDQKIQMENTLKVKFEEEMGLKGKQIEELNSQINFLQNHLENEQHEREISDKQTITFRDEIRIKEERIQQINSLINILENQLENSKNEREILRKMKKNVDEELRNKQEQIEIEKMANKTKIDRALVQIQNTNKNAEGRIKEAEQTTKQVQEHLAEQKQKWREEINTNILLSEDNSTLKKTITNIRREAADKIYQLKQKQRLELKQLQKKIDGLQKTTN